METRPAAWRVAVRLLVSVAFLLVLAYWLFISVFLATLRCDESCSGGEYDHWRWTAQLVLAGIGGLSGAVGLMLGFSTSRSASRACLWVSAGCLLAWLAWVLGFGSF